MRIANGASRRQRGAARPRARARRHPVLRQARAHPQYRLAHGRRALHGAHYFDPNKAAFQDFDPFWEFVSGPIHAGTGLQNEIDLTFGSQVVYAKARPHDPAVLGSPADGLQFFGRVVIDGATEVMTATLKDAADTALWSRQIEPQAA